MANSVAASSLNFVDKLEANYEAEKKSYANSFVYKDLLDYCSQAYMGRSGYQGFSSPEQVLRKTELDFQLSHASTWLRVGFADAPGILSLTTPKRLMTIDTRVPGHDAVQELLNITLTLADMDKGRSFNPAENIFHAQPVWYADTYALLGTDYNCIVMDKRMPGHPVLQWTHGLRGPMTYAEFCEFDEPCEAFPAQVSVVLSPKRPV